MELPAASLSRYAEPRTPWRKAAIVTAVIATLELVALLVVALAFVAKPLAADSSAKPGAGKAEQAAARGAATEEPPPATLPRAQTTVLVLNGNGVTGAAAQAARKLRRLDYSVAGVGDATRRDVPRTIVMYREGFEGEAVRLARDLGLGTKRAVPLDGLRAAELHGATLALVIGG